MKRGPISPRSADTASEGEPFRAAGRSRTLGSAYLRFGRLQIGTRLERLPQCIFNRQGRRLRKSNCVAKIVIIVGRHSDQPCQIDFLPRQIVLESSQTLLLSTLLHQRAIHFDLGGKACLTAQESLVIDRGCRFDLRSYRFETRARGNRLQIRPPTASTITSRASRTDC